jgi:hypothetical protein
VNAGHLFVSAKCVAMDAGHFFVSAKCVAMDAGHFFVSAKCAAMNAGHLFVSAKCAATDAGHFFVSTKCVAMNAGHFLISTKCAAMNDRKSFVPKKRVFFKCAEDETLAEAGFSYATPGSFARQSVERRKAHSKSVGRRAQREPGKARCG